eukprot:g8034.t1
MPSAVTSSTMPPGYTTKYFGLVDGELGVMSKVDHLEPRATSSDWWRAAAIPIGTGWSNICGTVEAFTAHADGVGATARAGRDLRSSSPKCNNPGTSLLGSRSSHRNRRGELFTAEKPPATKPVEGPEPPAWLESRVGLLRDPSEGGGPSAASLASVGECHGGSKPASEWTSPDPQVLHSKSCSTVGSGSGTLEGWGDESSAFALSFTSAPWAVSDDEGCDGTRARNSGPIKSARERRVEKAARPTLKPGLRKKAKHRGRKRGRLQARSGGGCENVTDVSADRLLSKTDAYPPEGNQRGRERDSAHGVVDDKINIGDGIRKPQPELYDVWIPQKCFQGKGLPTLKRVKGVMEPQPQVSSRPRGTQAMASTGNEEDNPSARPPNQGVVSLSRERGHHASRQQQKQPPETDKYYAVHYVGGPEDFTKDGAASPPQVPARAGLSGPGTKSACPADGERPAVSVAGVTHDTPENELEGEVKPLRVGGDDDDDDEDRDGSLWSDNTRCGESALVGDTAAAGGSIVGWQQQEGRHEGREKGLDDDDDENFDYAKRFSWQTAAEAVKLAEADAQSKDERRRRRDNGDGHQDAGVTEDEIDDEQLQPSRQQPSAIGAVGAATLRAKERSDNAARVAVGRLRAPQSVFNPLHRTPSRPEMRRSITHGRFSPVGRKLWRQSEGLSPRTGQLCLSPRRRLVAGEGNGIGVAPSSGGGPVDVADWYEGRPSFSTHLQENQRGLTDVAFNTGPVSADSNDRFEGSGASFADVPPTSARSNGGEQTAEIAAGQVVEGTKTAGEGVTSLNPTNDRDNFVPRETAQGLHREETTQIGAAAAAAAAETATAITQGHYGALPTADRGRHVEGIPHTMVDAGAEFIDSARTGDGDAQVEWAESAHSAPECPPHSISTRCRSYTVKLPWDGHK